MRKDRQRDLRPCLACRQGDERGFVIGDPAASLPSWGMKPETAAKRRKVAATKAARRRIEAKRLAQAELLPDFDDARKQRLMPSKREKRKTQFGSRVGWSQQEDEVMLRGYLWCVARDPGIDRWHSILDHIAPTKTLIFVRRRTLFRPYTCSCVTGTWSVSCQKVTEME